MRRPGTRLGSTSSALVSRWPACCSSARSASPSGSARAQTVGPAPTIGLGPVPTGLIALQFYQPGKPAPGPCAPPAPIFSDKVFTDPLISGVDLGIEWQYLEPESASCQFNWNAAQPGLRGRRTSTRSLLC